MGRPLSAEDVGTRLRARFGDAVQVQDVFGHAVADVPRGSYRDVVAFCRDEPELACDFCDFTAGVDRGADGLQVVTHLHSTAHHHGVRIRVALPPRSRWSTRSTTCTPPATGTSARPRRCSASGSRATPGPSSCSSPSPSRATRSARTSR